LERRAQALTLCGKSLIADQSGAVFWPGERTLLVADLHLEKGSASAARGRFLPPYDTRETLQRLAETIDTYEPTRIVALGDSLHDRGAAERIDPDDLVILRLIQEDRDWIWITGNHDPEIAPALGGVVVEELELEGITLRHAPRAGTSMTHEIAGHLHPAARLSIHGHSVRRPCFVGNGRRLVLPAFGAYTGGLNVLDEAFLPLFGNDGFKVMMLGQDGVYPVATRNLRED
jgi:DNA ligase-associated metallophosphoesterase